MAKMKVTGIKGMPDMLPEDSAIWEKFTDTVRAAASGYGYRQIRIRVIMARSSTSTSGPANPKASQPNWWN